MMQNRRPVTVTTLNNGLTVALIYDPNTPIVSVKTIVKAGSMTEGAHLGKGLSHFLEHLVAGGATKMRSETDYQHLVHQMGGAYNAYTTLDHTCYYITTSPAHTQLAIQVLAEWVGHHAFNATEFNREKEVITREIEKGNAELGRVFYQLCQSNFFNIHPCRYPIIGVLDSFLSTTLDDLSTYYQQQYTASNMIAIVGSPYPSEQVMPWVESAYDNMPSLAPPAGVGVLDYPPTTSRFKSRSWDCQNAHLNLRFATVPLHHDDAHALDLLSTILTNGMASILYRTVVEESQLAYSIFSSSLTPHYTSGYFDFQLELEPKDITAVTQLIQTELSHLSKSVTQIQLDTAKQQRRAEEALSVTTIDDEVSRVGMGLLVAGNPYFSLDYEDGYQSVTLEQVLAVANRYLNPKRMVTTSLIPRNATIPSEIITSPSQSPHRFYTFPNGVRVVGMPDPSSTRASVKCFIKAGIRAENPNNNGIGSVVADLIGQRCEGWVKSDLVSFFESRGALFAASHGKHSLAVTLHCLPDTLTDLLPVAMQSVLYPTFHPDDLALSMKQSMNLIQSRPDDWYRHGLIQFRRHFFGQHPYAMPELGEESSVGRLTLSACTDWWNSMLDPRSIVVAVSGHVDWDRVIDQLGETLGRLEPPLTPWDYPLVAPNYPKQPLSGEIHHDVAACMTVYPGTTLSDIEGGSELDAVIAALTGYHYPGGLLHYALRGEGLVYMVHGTQFLGLDAGYMMVCALTSDEQQSRVIELIDENVQLLKTKPLPSETVSEVVAQLQFVGRERRADTAAFVSEMAIDELLGLGYDRYAKTDALIGKVTADSICEWSQKWLNSPLHYTFNRKKTM